ncbi:hypothetical protein CRUP_013809, partial [Coryphaenoides rupestris]
MCDDTQCSVNWDDDDGVPCGEGLGTSCLQAYGLGIVSQRHRDVERLGTQVRKSTIIRQKSIRSEWKLAKIAFVVIVVYVLSWSPYACVTMISWAGHASILSPYSKTVPAVIAKASTIYNPFIYAIIHQKY